MTDFNDINKSGRSNIENRQAGDPIEIYSQLSGTGNWQLVEELIGEFEEFTIAPRDTSLSDTDFDIAIFDSDGLQSTLGAAKSRKHEAEPVLLPYLLLLEGSIDDTLSLKKESNQKGDFSFIIDSILSIPTTKIEFAWRLKNLARQRRQSELLAERKRQIQSKYQNLADTAPDAIIVADVETGEIVESNPAAAELLEYTKNELAGKDVLSIHPTADQEKYRRLFQSHAGLAETGPITLDQLPDGGRIYVETKTGKKIPVEINGRTYEFQDQTLMTGIFRDISTRVERMERLESFKQITETTDVAVYWTDSDGLIKYVNPAFEDQTGYRADEAVGQTPSILKSDEHPESFYEEMWETITSGESWQGEVINERKNGEGYAVDQTITPLLNEQGDVMRFVSVSVDITDRKRREQKLRRRSRALDEAPIGMLITDPDQEDNPLIYVNKAVEEITGYAKEELIGENPRIFQGENTDPEKRAKFRKAIDNTEQTTVEIRNYRKDGSEFWSKMAIAPVMDDDGTVMNWVGFQEDVTERIQRTTQLSVMNRVLRHNMRNDMNVINGRANLLKENVAAEGEEDAVKTIIDMSEQLSEMAEKAHEITAILQEPPARAEINLESLVRTIVSDTSKKHPEADLKISSQGDTVASPCTEIASGIEELISNAIIHNDQKTPEVIIQLTERGQAVEIEFQDNGPTLDESERGLLLGNKPSQLQHGSGLGLWLVNIVATRSGGSVSYAENTPRGNIIRLRLP